MMIDLRGRFWLELGTALVSGLLLMLTMTLPTWIEFVFNIDPDQGGGWLEWLITLTSAAITLLLLGLARHEWQLRRQPTL